MSRAMNREEFVEFASFLFGPKWQTPMAKELGIDRRTLVRNLASDRPITESTARVVLSMVDGRISRLLDEQSRLIERIETLKREMALDTEEHSSEGDGRESVT